MRNQDVLQQDAPAAKEKIDNNDQEKLEKFISKQVASIKFAKPLVHPFAPTVSSKPRYHHSRKLVEGAVNESSSETDVEFDPTAEMLVNDFDDERTLDEEEAMKSEDHVQDELDDLQKQGDMPIEALLAMYGYNDGNHGDSQSSSSSAADEVVNPASTPEKKKDIPSSDAVAPEEVDNDGKVDLIHELLDGVNPAAPTSRLLRSSAPHHQSESESETEDEDYTVDEDDEWKKVIQVGSDYQAVIPEGLRRYDDAPAYENDDKLLWDPSRLLDKEVDEYLTKVQQPPSGCSQGVFSIPTGSHVRDDEQALYLLLQCGHNVDEALRRKRMQSAAPTETMSLWSEEECRSFEQGICNHGKDFHAIQFNKVRTRSVGELVQFYYIWKKTERHDVFANKARLEKKKYALHPGTTDYMDRFLDEQENPNQHKDRSSSPNVHSLISGDHKRQQQAGQSSSSSSSGNPDGSVPFHSSPSKAGAGSDSAANAKYGAKADDLSPSPRSAGKPYLQLHSNNSPNKVVHGATNAASVQMRTTAAADSRNDGVAAACVLSVVESPKLTNECNLGTELAGVDMIPPPMTHLNHSKVKAMSSAEASPKLPSSHPVGKVTALSDGSSVH